MAEAENIERIRFIGREILDKQRKESI